MALFCQMFFFYSKATRKPTFQRWNKKHVKTTSSLFWAKQIVLQFRLVNQAIPLVMWKSVFGNCLDIGVVWFWLVCFSSCLQNSERFCCVITSIRACVKTSVQAVFQPAWYRWLSKRSWSAFIKLTHLFSPVIGKVLNSSWVLHLSGACNRVGRKLMHHKFFKNWYY